MKTSLTSLSALLIASTTSFGQLIVSDTSDVTGTGTGFGLNAGVNSGINPPVTRMTGSAAPNLRYIHTATGKDPANYSIAGGKIAVKRRLGSGRFTVSADGTTAYNFGSALGTSLATAANPVIYDVSIKMANNLASTTRFSFALGTVEENANLWDFGVQLYRTNATENFYQIGKRIDVVSYTTGTDSSGATGDLNESIFVTGANTYGSELGFLIRVTDAGAESTTFNSRIQMSMDGGGSWFYDTQTDSDLAGTGFRFDGLGRYFIWDQAGATASGSATVTYDDWSVNLVQAAVPEPSVFALGLVGLLTMCVRRRF